MTSDTCGPTSGTPFASYDPASRCWRTSEATSLWALTLSSLTLPSWGCLHAGELYELQTPEPRTDALDSSSSSDLLPTPTVMDMGANYTPEEWEAWKAAQKANHNNGNGHGASLTQEAMSLLPTPTSADGLGGHLSRSGSRSNELLLAGIAKQIGESTAPPSPAGSASSSDPHPAPPSPAPTDDLDCLPLSWNG